MSYAKMKRDAHARGVIITDTVVWGDCILGRSNGGNFYQWMGGHWVILKPRPRRSPGKARVRNERRARDEGAAHDLRAH